MPAIKSHIDLAIFELSYLLTFIYLFGFFKIAEKSLLIQDYTEPHRTIVAKHENFNGYSK